MTGDAATVADEPIVCRLCITAYPTLADDLAGNGCEGEHGAHTPEVVVLAYVLAAAVNGVGTTDLSAQAFADDAADVIRLLGPAERWTAWQNPEDCDDWLINGIPFQLNYGSTGEGGGSLMPKHEVDRMTYEDERARHDVPVDLVITTRVPSKWLVIDRETGNVWEHRDGMWRHPVGMTELPWPADMDIEQLAAGAEERRAQPAVHDDLDVLDARRRDLRRRARPPVPAPDRLLAITEDDAPAVPLV